MMSELGLAASLALAAVLCIAAPAEAHNGNVKYLDVVTTSDGASADVRVDAIDAAAATGLGADLDDCELETRAAVVTAWMLRGLRLESDAGSCPADAAEPELVDNDGRPVVSLDVRFACPAGHGAMVLYDDSIDAGDERHRSIVRVGETTRVLGDGNASVAISAPPTVLATAHSFMVEGATHLVTGYDHMLFLLSLLFAAGVLAHRRGTRVASRDVAWVVTAFTLGHSVTLVTAALELVTLPARLVEPAIAASIIAVAALNILKPETTVGRPWLALAFGLVHGFGFSSVLADVGLPGGQRVVALAAFNVGIELAQLCFVALAIAPLAWLARRERFYRTAVMRAGSLAIAGLASFWLVERAVGL